MLPHAQKISRILLRTTFCRFLSEILLATQVRSVHNSVQHNKLQNLQKVSTCPLWSFNFCSNVVRSNSKVPQHCVAMFKNSSSTWHFFSFSDVSNSQITFIDVYTCSLSQATLITTLLAAILRSHNLLRWEKLLQKCLTDALLFINCITVCSKFLVSVTLNADDVMFYHLFVLIVWCINCIYIFSSFRVLSPKNQWSFWCRAYNFFLLVHAPLTWQACCISQCISHLSWSEHTDILCDLVFFDHV